MVEQKNEEGEGSTHSEFDQVHHGQVDGRTVYWFVPYFLEERGLNAYQWKAPDEEKLIALCVLASTWIHPGGVGAFTSRFTVFSSVAGKWIMAIVDQTLVVWLR